MQRLSVYVSTFDSLIEFLDALYVVDILRQGT